MRTTSVSASGPTWPWVKVPDAHRSCVGVGLDDERAGEVGLDQSAIGGDASVLLACCLSEHGW